MFEQWSCSSRTLGDDSLGARCLSYELSIYQIRILRETSSDQTKVRELHDHCSNIIMERTGTVVEGLDSQQNSCKIDDRVGNLKFSCRD